MAIVITFLLASLVMVWKGLIPVQTGTAVIASCALVSIVGFFDDRGHINAGWRLLVHCLAATIVIVTLGGIPNTVVFGYPISFGLFGYVLGVLFLVWMLNLYNFMDGINGIAGVEAITTLVCAALLIHAINGNNALIVVLMVLTGSVAGFLIWNFPIARIFMGDAGSGFLGFSIATLSLWSTWNHPTLFWSWLILLGVFIVDATFTLLRRLARGDRVYEAHRSHAYQHAAQRLGSHAPVTLAIGAINLLWLFPWAWAAATLRIDGAIAAVIAYLPLLAAAWSLGAGARFQTTNAALR